MLGLSPVLWFATACLLVGVGVLAWGWVGDRSRGRRRCSGCWYDMTGVVGRRCPECGREHGEERRLFRTRRRWGVAGAGLAGLACGASVGAWEAAKAGCWRGWLPDAVVVRMAPGREGESAHDATTGTSRVSPWVQELKGRAGRLSDGDLLTALRSAEVLTVAGPVKPGKEMVVGLRVPWRWLGAAEIELTPRLKGLACARAGDVNEGRGCGLPRMARMQSELRQRLGIVPPGVREVEFDVRVKMREVRASRGWLDRGYDVRTRELGVLRVAVDGGG